MKIKTNLFLLVMSIIGFLFVSVSFLLMPLNNDSSEPNMFAGVFFWCSLLISIVFQVILSFRIRKANRNNTKHGLGLLKFFQNKYAKISDVVFVISAIGLLVAMITTDGLGYSCYTFLAMTVFFFSMHCIFNGKNYNHIRKEMVQDVLDAEMLEEYKKENDEK